MIKKVKYRSLPFSLQHRKGRKYIYVQFKTPTGEYMSAVSTKCTTDSSAMQMAFKWMKEGIPVAKEKERTQETKAKLRNVIKEVESKEEVQYVCEQLSKTGLLKSYTVAGSKGDILFVSFLNDFWNFQKSQYMKERQARGHCIHKAYSQAQRCHINKWWKPFFCDKLLGEITKQSIDEFMLYLSSSNLSGSSKNIVLTAGIVPLRWAFSKCMIMEDVTKGLVWFSLDTKERAILSIDTVKKLFSVEWNDKRGKLSNLLACVTGMRCGEILALRMCDIGNGELYVRHSWNAIDRLKGTKTNKERIVELPFLSIENALKNMAECNPKGCSSDSYIFWSSKNKTQPMHKDIPIESLRCALVSIGIKEQEARKYVFHSWRHFYATHMRERLSCKLVMSQTGHSSKSILEHYADHRIQDDRIKIRNTARDIFSNLLPCVQ